MGDPQLTVIIPCFNQGRFLGEAVRSVQLQTVSDWECIIINDGSTDDTAEVARRLATADSRVRFINQANRGLGGARNRGLTEAQGQFIQFLDADDAIKPSKFELQVRALGQTDGPALVYCDYYVARENNLDTEEQGRYRDPRFRSGNPLAELAQRWERRLSIPCHCFLFDARFFGAHGIRFDETLPNHEDWDCWMRIFALKPDIHYVDAKLAVYRFRSDSMCRNLRWMRDGYLAAIDKQQTLFAGDEAMLAILKEKRREVVRAYRCIPVRRLVNELKRLVVHT